MQERKHEEKQIISDMADEMLRLGEGCTEDQIAIRFTRAQIKEYGEEARALANLLSQRDAA
ncbi:MULTISPECIES: hypothetical protein [Rhizobium/Agrobacterium group]|uniref:hypothetical protein n=1 Tax=Rhizobium/Agrobacterium group TaxID=227290 RepID=UPI001A97EBA7|nr:hypothetical protein [Rhizobium sp. ZX09]QSZ59175.1 hypothetical protein BTN45_18310 [Rhizobium sp. ZX09]